MKNKLGYILKKIVKSEGTALFTNAKPWKQTKCLSIEEQMKTETVLIVTQEHTIGVTLSNIIYSK